MMIDTVAAAIVTAMLFQAQPAPATQPAAPAPPVQTAPQHLAAAKAALDKVHTLPGAAGPKLAELKRQFADLEKVYVSGGARQYKQEPQPVGSRVTVRQTTDWAQRVVQLDRLIGDLVNTVVPTEASRVVDAASRETLNEFRKHLTAFASAATGTVGPAAPKR